VLHAASGPPFAKNAKSGAATPLVLHAEINSLGHPPNLLFADLVVSQILCVDRL
jgi:hypothetical protein